VDFDPAVVSYEQLLAAFWSGDDHTVPAYSEQYRYAVFFTSERQRRLAEVSKTEMETRLGSIVHTSIESFTGFHVAEDYHQKYYLRQIPELAGGLYAAYPDPAAFRDSTAAAKLNGYAGGYGDSAALARDLDRFGLSGPGRKALLDIVASGLTQACPAAAPRPSAGS
jgi:peptide-methionine (S)-S-oxide reductase